MSPYQTTSRPIKRCQVCGHAPLESILYVGSIPPVNTMPVVGSVPEEQPTYPLEMLRCTACTLVQIGCEVNADVLFPPEYPYLSGSTRILRENFADLCREATKLLGLKAQDLVIDIGSNDGTLLSNFKDAGFRVLGVDPSRATEIANQRGITSKMAFFNKDFAKELKTEVGTAKLITAANVFAHIGDIHSVVDGIVELLDPDNGVFISESHYLLGLVKTVQYDTLYHEHLRYYSLKSLAHLLKQHHLEVFHVQLIPTHGGSIRVYAARKGQRKILPSVDKQLGEEEKAGLTSGKAFKTFRRRVVKSKYDLLGLLGKLKKKGAHIYGIGAPSRASTLISYTGLDDGMLDCIMEIKTSHKVNKYMPGTRIPVLDEAKLFKDQPKYALLLSWHIAKELIANLKKNGYKGKFIVPLPTPKIVS